MNADGTEESTPEALTPEAETLELLEFPLVKARVAAFCTLSPARERTLALIPSQDVNEIGSRQQETQEARLFIESHETLELTGVHDVGPLIHRASLEGVLKGKELRELHDTLQASRTVRATLGNRNDLPLLARIGSAIPDLRELERLLASTVDETGELRDGASRELRMLRLDASEARARLDGALERAVRRLRRSNVLQEPLVTERNGRMVLLVKMEMRYRVPGIVHDVSDSGATAFVEPMAAVGLGNQWREASLAAQREEERILRGVSTTVGYNGLEILQAMEALTKLDVAVAMGRYSMLTQGTAPVFVQAEQAFLNLSRARHPLLQGSVVPIDVSVGGGESVLIITGPNAGGKTVALKTAGLLAIMAQSGFHVPAAECTMTVFDQVYADIGDQQSIERSLSSFSSHLQTLRWVMEQATPNSLVLLDELGTSTDPEEGAALAKAVLGFFEERMIPCVATTHHREVAAYVQDQPGMANASVEMDPGTLEPTFRLTKGLPGRSYALTIAGRMGVDPATVERARSLLSEEHRQAEVLLRQLEQERYLAEQQRKAAEGELERNQAMRRELEGKLAELETNKEHLLEEARFELQSRADDLWKRLQRAERAFIQPQSAAAPMQSEPKEYKEEVALVRAELRSEEWEPAPKAEGSWVQELTPGDFVYVRGVPNPVEVLAPPNENRTVEVALGAIRARLPSHHLERKAEVPSLKLPERVSYTGPVGKPMGREVDLRGMRVEEAEDRLDSVLDQAALQGLRKLRVVHGGGTGALRSLVRERLKGHPLVKEIRAEDGRSSGSVTLVELK